VNQPIYAIPQISPTTGVASLTAVASGNVAVGKIINVQGTGSTLQVTFIAEI
jgi:hypothetical protein